MIHQNTRKRPGRRVLSGVAAVMAGAALLAAPAQAASVAAAIAAVPATPVLAIVTAGAPAAGPHALSGPPGDGSPRDAGAAEGATPAAVQAAQAPRGERLAAHNAPGKRPSPLDADARTLPGGSDYNR